MLIVLMNSDRLKSWKIRLITFLIKCQKGLMPII